MRTLIGLGFLLGCLAWLIPNHYFPWTAFYNEFAAVLALLLAGLALVPAVRHCRLPFVLLALATALGSYLLVQFWFAPGALSTSLLVIVGGYLVTLLAAYFVGFQARPEEFPLVVPLALVFVTASILSVGLALLQWLEIGIGIWLMDMPSAGRPYGNLAQPNNLGTLLLLGVASTVLLRTQGLVGRVGVWLVVLFALLGIALTQSRTAVVGLVILAVCVLVGRKRIGLPVTLGEIAGVFVLFAALISLLPPLQEALMLNGGSLAARGAGSPERIVLWMQTLDAIRLAPSWLGYGWHQVGPALVEIAPAYETMLYAEYSHNLFLDLMIWNGVPVGLLIITLILWWSVTRAARFRNADSWYALSVIAVVAVHAMLELPHAYAYFLIPVGLLAGVVDRDQVTAHFRFDSRWLIPAVLGGGVLLFALFLEYRQIEEAHREMRFAAARIGNPPSVDAVPNVKLLGHLADFIRFARSEAREGMTDEELEWMRNVVRNNAYPPALFRYALALGLNHRHEDAALELRRLRVLHGEEMYAEARVGWMSLVERHPQLEAVVWE